MEDDTEYGVGLTWMNRQQAENPPPDDAASTKPIPYENEKLLGHGSATASILRVGLDSGIVIGAGRMEHGQSPNDYVDRIVRTVHEHAIER